MSDFALPSAAGQRTVLFKRRSTGWIAASLVVLGLVAALVVVSVAPAAAVTARTDYGTHSGQMTPSLGGARNAAGFAAGFVWVRPPGPFGNGPWQRAISKQISSGTFGSSSVYVPYKSRSLGPSAGCCHKVVNPVGSRQWRKRWHKPQRIQMR
jgi:hypothetical protein